MSNTDSTVASPSAADNGRPNQRSKVDFSRIPELTIEDKNTISRINREGSVKYTLPLFIGTSAGLYTLSHFKYIKKTGLKNLWPYYLGGLVMSSITARILNRERLAAELASLDTPMGKFMRDNGIGTNKSTNWKNDLSNEESWKNDFKKSLENAPKYEQKSWEPPKTQLKSSSEYNQPLNILGTDYNPPEAPEKKKNPRENKPKEKPKRYNKYGDEIMD